MGLIRRSSRREPIAEKERGKGPVIALAGNPNVGKSTVFNALTGLRQHTGNWTGKTVELACGRFSLGEKELTLVDLPGCYSLSPASGEEAVARDFLLREKPDAVIAVVSAACPERSLALALEVLSLGLPTVVLLNLADEAERAGKRVDAKLLSRRLGVPAVLCSARNGSGLAELRAALEEVLSGGGGDRESEFFTGDYYKHRGEGGMLEKSERCLRECSRLLCGAASEAPHKGKSLTERIDRIVTGRFTALPLMFLLLLGVFYLTLVGANYPSRLLSGAFGSLEELLYRFLTHLGAAPFVRDALVLGIFRTVSFVVSVMLPPMAIFFPLFSLLEDLGFLPRAAFCLDRCFARCGSCGKQALTMCMGFGCNAAGVVGCRIMSGEREKRIAMLTNSFVPCNGRFPLIMTLTGLFFVPGGNSPLAAAAVLAALVVISVLMSLAATKLLSETVFRGKSGSFLMELPPYRPPKVLRVLITGAVDRTARILLRAVLVAAPAGLVLFILANIQTSGGPLLSSVCGSLNPLARFFGLDGPILTAFILALPANELVLPILLMAYTSGGALAEAGGAELFSVLTANGWTALTALSVMLFSLFHWPCSTTLLTIRKEAGGVRWMLLAAALPTAFGLLILALINIAARLLL